MRSAETLRRGQPGYPTDPSMPLAERLIEARRRAVLDFEATVSMTLADVVYVVLALLAAGLVVCGTAVVVIRERLARVEEWTRIHDVTTVKQED
jgi:hypothetical protein